MGTRADFYVGRGVKAEWLGSVAWDGDPSGVSRYLLAATTAEEFRLRFKSFTYHRADVTLPKDGWPWPWENSRTTDYAYCFYRGKVWASRFGHRWFDPLEETSEPDGPKDGPKVAIFPNMKRVQNVTLGERSGLLVFTRPAPKKK